MASVNTVKKIYTHEGAVASHVNPTQQLERSVMSCLLWEREFYEDGQSIADRIKGLVKQVAPEEVARIILQAKNDMRLRHVPLLLTRELARSVEGRKQLKFLFEQVITRPDDITEFLAMYKMENPDEPLAKQIKKHLGDTFRKFDEYQLAKYNGGKKAVKLRDALRMLRPKPLSDVESGLWKRLVDDELAIPQTWEVELSKPGADKKAVWTGLIKEGKLGGFATLRNIRNMRQAGVDDETIKHGIKNINAGRLLPINFISAAKHNPQYEPLLEEKFFQCFSKNKVAGKTILLVDVSYSMTGQLSGRSELARSDVACSLSMIAREMFEDIRIFTFAYDACELPARHGFALRDAIKHSIGGGTYLGKALNQVAKNPHDRLIVITDEQSHDPVPQMNGYMINVASNQNGVGYGQWTHIDGWSDKVLDYILRYEESNRT